MLTNAEKERVRYHLGYMNTDPAASIMLGVPGASQPLFLMESAMNRLLPEGEARVREHLATLDMVEGKLRECMERMAATRVGEIDLNPREPQMLEREYKRWQARLARQLGAYANPFDPSGAGGGGVNVPVAGA